MREARQQLQSKSTLCSEAPSFKPCSLPSSDAEISPPGISSPPQHGRPPEHSQVLAQIQMIASLDPMVLKDVTMRWLNAQRTVISNRKTTPPPYGQKDSPPSPCDLDCPPGLPHSLHLETHQDCMEFRAIRFGKRATQGIISKMKELLSRELDRTPNRYPSLRNIRSIRKDQGASTREYLIKLYRERRLWLTFNESLMEVEGLCEVLVKLI